MTSIWPSKLIEWKGVIRRKSMLKSLSEKLLLKRWRWRVRRGEGS